MTNERVVLAYGDSNTHGTAPMVTLEDSGQARAGGALAGGAGRRARRRLAGGRGGAAGADHGLSRSGLGGAQERPGAVAGGAGEPPADRRGGADARHQRSQAPVSRSRWWRSASSCSALLHLIRHSYMGPNAIQLRMLLVSVHARGLLQAGCLAAFFEGGAAKSLKLVPAYAAVAARHGGGLPRRGPGHRVDFARRSAFRRGGAWQARAGGGGVARRDVCVTAKVYTETLHMEAVWNAYGMRMASKWSGLNC